MAVFFDDFDRANGALGGNWTNYGTALTISGQYATGGAASHMYNTTVSSVGAMTAEARLGYGGANALLAGPIVKAGGGSGGGYLARIRLTTGTYYFVTGAVSGSVFTEKAAVSLGTVQPFLWTISITYDGGTITATYNGGNTLTFNDLTYSASQYCGIWSYDGSSRIDWVRFTAGTAALLDVAESVVGNFGTATTLHLTGTGTAWTPGTPGSPTFSCDHGTLSGQEVLTSTTATVVYDPGSYLGTVTVTDPSTGATDTFLVTSDTGIITPPGFEGERPTQEGADLLDDAANGVRHAGTVVLNEQAMLTIPVMSYEETVASIWNYIRYIATGINPPGEGTNTPDELLKWVSGGYLRALAVDVAPSNTTLKQDAAALAAALDALTQSGTISLVDLGGSPTLYSHADIIAALGNISTTTDLTPVTDLLYAMWGSSRPTLTQLAEMIDYIRTIAGYSLGDVLDAIHALPSPDNTAVLAAIAALGGSIGAIALELAGLVTAEAADAASSAAAAAEGLAALGVLAEMGLQLLDILNQLKALNQAQPTVWYHPPVWPGLAHVQMGAPQDLQSGLVVPGPMHGVVVDITSTDPGTGFYDYDVDRCWRNIGAVSFVTDRGDHEHWQPLGFSKAMYVPKTMHEAASCKLHLGRGPQGTITPWSIVTE